MKENLENSVQIKKEFFNLKNIIIYCFQILI